MCSPMRGRQSLLGLREMALEPGLIRIRMGLHTGEALLTGEGYVGRVHSPTADRSAQASRIPQA